MNLTDFLLMKNGNTVKPGADLFDILLAKKLGGGAGIITTLVGNPLNFTAKKAQIAQSTKVTLEPVQAGSGDPSPTNIRPISGRTSVEIKGCRKNLCNYEDMEIVSLIDNTRPGVIVGGLKAGGTYKIKAFTEPSSNQYIYAKIQHADGTQEDYKTIVQARRIYTRTFTVAEGDVIIIWNPSSGSTIDGSKTIFTARQIMMTYGETEPETYEAYTESNDVTISFGETVYSGTLDVEQGQVLVDKEYVDFSTITINKNNNDPDNWNYYLRKTGFSYSRNMLCSHLIYSRTIPANSIGLSSRDTNRAIYMNFLDAIGVNDASHFRQFCIDNNVQLLCEIETPRTIQLTPEQIQILKGQNTIWIEDEGAVMELSYMD